MVQVGVRVDRFVFKLSLTIGLHLVAKTLPCHFDWISLLENLRKFSRFNETASWCCRCVKVPFVGTWRLQSV